MRIFNKEEHTLYVCTVCGTVSVKEIITEHTRNEVVYLECPVCHNKIEIDF